MNSTVLSDVLWPASAQSGWLRPILLAVMGSLLIWLSAKVQIPFWPVPLTLQTLVILGLGAAYGWRLAGATLMLYLAQGAVGWPVFAGTPEKGIGLIYMAGPTGGYLIGFLFAAMLVGFLAQRGFDRNPFRMFAAMLLGNLVIYGLGTAWLAWGVPVDFFGSGFNGLGLDKAIQFGVTPFILPDVIKSAIAALLFPAIWLLFKNRFQ